jgi:prohibitin 1
VNNRGEFNAGAEFSDVVMPAKETQQAQRKPIEAEKIRDFQQIVAQGISPQLLKWKGIEATEELADVITAKLW